MTSTYRVTSVSRFVMPVGAGGRAGWAECSAHGVCEQHSRLSSAPRRNEGQSKPPGSDTAKGELEGAQSRERTDGWTAERVQRERDRPEERMAFRREAAGAGRKDARACVLRERHARSASVRAEILRRGGRHADVVHVPACLHLLAERGADLNTPDEVAPPPFGLSLSRSPAPSARVERAVPRSADECGPAY
eukprot:443327-Rhodomonas_salina.1